MHVERPREKQAPRRLWWKVLFPSIGIFVFVASLLVGAALHLELSSARQALRRTLVAYLNTTFQGQFIIGELSSLGPFGLRAHDLEIRDPRGSPVLQAEQVSVSFDLFETFERTLRFYEKLSIIIDEVELAQVHLVLSRSPRPSANEDAFQLTIAEAFVPRTERPTAEPSGRAVRVWFPDVRVKTLTVRSELSQAPRALMTSPFLQGQLLVTDVGVAADLPELELNVTGLLPLELALHGKTQIRVPGAISGSVDVLAGQLRGHEDFHYERGLIRASGNVEAINAKDAKTLWGDYPFEGTLGFKHEIQGVLPRLTIDAEVSSGAGRMSAQGRIRVDPEIEADLDLDTQDLDLSLLRRDLPKTTLSLRSAVELWGASGRVVASINATLLPGLVAGEELPAVDLLGSYDERGFLGEATLHERGLPVHVVVRRPEEGATNFELVLKRAQLENSPRVQRYAAIKGQVEGNVLGTVDQGRLVLTPRVAVQGLSYAGTSVRQLTLTGQTETPLDAPVTTWLDLDLNAQSVSRAKLEMTTLSAKAQGTFLEPALQLKGKFKDGTELTAQAIARTDRFEIRQLSAKVTGQEKPIVVSFAHASYGGGRGRLSGFEMESTGHMTADAAFDTRTFDVRLDAQGLDLGRIARVLRLPEGSVEGRLSVETDLHLGERSDGHLRARVEHGVYQGIPGIELELDSTIDGVEVSGRATTAVESLGSGVLDWTGSLGGSPLEKRSWSEMVGQARVELAHLDLRLASILSAPVEGVRDLRGQLSGSVELKRARPENFPSAQIALKTVGFRALIFDRDVAGVDLEAIGELTPELERLSLALRAEDVEGDLATISCELHLPIDDWAQRAPGLTELDGALRTAPLEAVLSLPERDFDTFPRFLSLPELTGRLSARGTARGQLQDPVLSLRAEVKALGGSVTQLGRLIDLETNVRYQPRRSTLSGQAVARSGDNRWASTTFDLALTEGGGANPAWVGHAQAVLDGVPLDAFRSLQDEGVQGLLQGAVVIERDSLHPKLDADLSVRRLQIRGRALGEGRIQAQKVDSTFRAQAEFHDEYGALQADLAATLLEHPWLPLLAADTPIVASLKSQRYDAAVLQPAVSDVISELQGALAGELKAEFFPKHGNEEPKLTLRGRLQLTEGVLTPLSMGLRLNGVELDVEAIPEGKYNAIYIKDLRAMARSEAHNLKGNGVLYFEDLDLVRGSLSISQEQVPILSEGIKLLDLSGQATAKFERRADALHVSLNVPELTALLPTTTDRDLITLDENPTISVLQEPTLSSPDQALPKSLPLLVDVTLGDRVRVKSQIASIKLTGAPHIRYAEKLTIGGRIGLAQGGRVQVLGRVFIIEHGTVFFDSSDPTDPLIDTTATWRAPNGTLVRATLSGSAKKPRLAWSSDPPLAGGEPAIIALVLGASGEGQGGTGAGIAYGAAVLNQMLGQTGLRGVEISAARQSTGDGQVARLSERSWESYSAAVQLSDEVWFEGKYTQEAAGPDNRSRSGFSGTVDWRFDPSWSLRTEVGTLGAGLDLLWQYRY